MRKRLIAAALALAFPLAAAPTPAPAQSPSGQNLTPRERGAYATVAGAAELFAIRSAEIAVEKAQRPEVRDYAQTILTEHRRSSERFAETVRAVGLEALLPPAMLPFQWERLRRLERASRRRFDRTFIDQQIEAHETAVELHRNFAANGNDPQLQAFAEAAQPVASRHLEQARRLDVDN